MFSRQGREDALGMLFGQALGEPDKVLEATAHLSLGHTVDIQQSLKLYIYIDLRHPSIHQRNQKYFTL